MIDHPVTGPLLVICIHLQEAEEERRRRKKRRKRKRRRMRRRWGRIFSRLCS
jgi:hypothetical protein